MENLWVNSGKRNYEALGNWLYSIKETDVPCSRESSASCKTCEEPTTEKAVTEVRLRGSLVFGDDCVWRFSPLDGQFEWITGDYLTFLLQSFVYKSCNDLLKMKISLRMYIPEDHSGRVPLCMPSKRKCPLWQVEH
ncbi:hypothetical protein M514_00076 [Trichuris suis]|uniref:Uncharacterized protein n=1 Tax=Trichuris suis TaxID=68888 RepID=A0A085NTZ7_9BILA|nr:hypothetical protein M513_00076 [Trichuris suis]KFD72943.1 hypothetical protein M514_00076 [Trichuris suis]